MTITHKMQSGKTDSPDPSRVQPSNWNDEHDVTGLLGKLLPLTADTPGVPYLADDGSGAMAPSTAIGRSLLAIDSLAALLISLGAAPLDSPVFLNTPRAPTPDLLDNSTHIATTQFVQALVAALVDSSPSALDTLNELAAALGDDPNFATTVTTALGNRLRIDAAQSLTSGQKAQGLLNLGIVLGAAANNVVQLDGSAKMPAVDGSALLNVTATNGAVRYDTGQSLTGPQQQQGRANIGVGAAAAISKSSAYTVVAADAGSTIRCSAALTLSLTAAATLGANFMFDVVNNALSGNAITIDPNGSETINGFATLKVFPGERATIICDGSNWSAFGLSPLVLLSSQTVSAAAAVAFTSLFDASFSSFGFRTAGLLGSTAGTDLAAQVSTNAGSTWFASSTDYRVNYVVLDQGGSLSGVSAAADRITLCQIGTGSLASFEMELFDLNSATNYKTTQQRQAGAGVGGLRYMQSSSQLIGAGASVVNGVRFLPVTGTITGTFELYGRR
jgi:hypothetical protein